MLPWREDTSFFWLLSHARNAPRMAKRVQPYRSAALRERELASRDLAAWDIASVAVVLWEAGVLRVVAGAISHEPVGRELGLALALIVVLPWFARRRRR